MRKLQIAIALVPGIFASAATTGGEPNTVDYTVAAYIDAQGLVLQADPGKDVPKNLVEPLRRTVSSWRFKPATRNGHAVPVRTYVRVQAPAVPNREEGDGGVHLQYMDNGPGFDRRQPPAYPPEMIRMRRQAYLTMLATVEPDGHLDNIQVERAETSGGASANAFIVAATQAIQDWRGKPEMVAGTPVATAVRMPIRFALTMTDAQGQAHFIKSEQPLRPVIGADHAPYVCTDDQPVALDSPVEFLGGPDSSGNIQ